MNIAIFGAAGAVGPVLAGQLLPRGHQVRAVGRRLPELRAAIPEAQPFVADLTDAAQARAAAEGQDAIVYAVGVPYNRFELHPPMMRAALAAAKEAGVRRFLHISTVYPYGKPLAPLVDETQPRRPNSRKGAWRLEQEQLVEAAHDPVGLRTMIIRPPDFFGPTAKNSMIERVVTAALAGKRADVLGPVDRPHEFIYVPDMGPILADLLERPDAFGEAYNIAGSGATTVHEIVRLIYAEAGTPMRIRVATPLLLRAMGLFDPIMRELVEMQYLMDTPVLLDDAKLQRVLPNVVKTPYPQAIAQTVRAAREALHVAA